MSVGRGFVRNIEPASRVAARIFGTVEHNDSIGYGLKYIRRISHYPSMMYFPTLPDIRDYKVPLHEDERDWVSAERKYYRTLRGKPPTKKGAKNKGRKK
jgi:hypothetical protein